MSELVQNIDNERKQSMLKKNSIFNIMYTKRNIFFNKKFFYF